MSNTERVIAFNSIFAACGLDPHEASQETKQLVHDAALKYAKFTAQTQTQTQPARPSQSGWPVVFPPYGRQKGQPIHGADVATLRFYESGSRRSLADPSKERFHEKERAMLAAIESELRRQGELGDDDQFNEAAKGIRWD